ncbi:hypothetical protein FANTH_10320 [Fusarium anthophilum]|uniref:Uncharacterized protein n=1 Tax=Fusarium anthophilum TaxID=48485 RepID=A0A8H4Z237_9HYPO|nr:hypothetical protein FANTH_10320 [Fusarium anthophilum]
MSGTSFRMPSSSGGPEPLTAIREQTSVLSSIDNDLFYHNPGNNLLSINGLLCSEINGTLPSGDCTTPPSIVKLPPSILIFEITDPDVTDQALRRAPRRPLLLYSLLAVSSSHKSRFLDDPEIAQGYARYGEEYHEKSCSTILRWYEELSAVTDAAGSVFAAELIASYPDAKVVLNYRRDLNTWHESSVKTLLSVHENWALYTLSYLGKVPFWGWHVYERFMWPGLFRVPDGNIETGIPGNGKWFYKEHCNMIRGLVPKEKLLELIVEDEWEPLCKFLDKAIPDEPFPHVNKASGWETHEAEVPKRYLMSALPTLTGLSAIGIATGAIAYKTMW